MRPWPRPTAFSVARAPPSPIPTTPTSCPPIDTPVGKLGLLLGRDVRVPEVSRILALQGADVLVAPLAPQAPYSAEEAMAGLWREVQQNQTFGLEAGLVGDLGGRVRDGKAALLGPCELAADQSGFLGRIGYLVREGALTARLDFEALAAVRRDHPLRRQMNPSLYRSNAAPWRPDAAGGRPADEGGAMP
jgi:predicted amidohydrolase